MAHFGSALREGSPTWLTASPRITPQPRDSGTTPFVLFTKLGPETFLLPHMEVYRSSAVADSKTRSCVTQLKTSRDSISAIPFSKITRVTFGLAPALG